MDEQPPKKILVVDDEPDILTFVKYNLEKEGFLVTTAGDGEEGLQKAEEVSPDLILMDIMMPKLDGVELCHALRNQEQFENTLIAFLTARTEEYAEIASLEAGGDDFITKPIRPRVLVSRVKALLRRSNRLKGGQAEQILIFDQLKINKDRFSVSKEEKEIELTRKEFEILWLLASRPGKVFTRRKIHVAIWGSDVMVGERTIDVHVNKLREKLGADTIKTIKGLGYKFE